MKKTWFSLPLAALLAVTLALVAARPAAADHCGDDTRVVGDNFVLGEGETLTSNLIVVGGDATVEAGARVDCTVVVFGGNLDIAGSVAEDVVVFGGDTHLDSTAEVDGELVTFGGSVSRAEGSEVRGGEAQGFSFDHGFRGDWMPFNGNPVVGTVLGFYQSMFETFLTAVALGLLALLVVLFWPDQTAHVGAAVTSAPAASGGMGLLTAVAVPVILGLVALTVCLAPVSFVGAILLAAGFVFGWVALGLVVGTRLGVALKLHSLSPAVAAALGTSLLSLVMSAISAIPCVGWVGPVVLACIGLGAVVLTRFGTRPYLGSPPLRPAPPPVPPMLPNETGQAPLAS